MCKNCDLVQFFTVVLDNVKMWRYANGLRNMSNIVPVKKSIHDIDTTLPPEASQPPKTTLTHKMM